MAILVTGGAGFIGSHTCVELLNAGHSVVVVDNLSNSHQESLKRVEAITDKNVRFYQVDILDEAALVKVFEKESIDAVIHFAGLKAVGESVAEPLTYYQNNVQGTLVLLQVMARFGVKQLVFSSSATVYGNPEVVPIVESAPLSATNPYGQTKLVIENMLRELAQSDPCWSLILLRYFNPVGAHVSGLIGEDPQGIPNNLMPYITQVAIGKRDALSVFGNDYPTKDGTGVRDYIHVVDLARGHLKALEKLSDVNDCVSVNLGTGHGYSVLDMVEAFEAVTGQKVAYQISPRRPGDVASCFADPHFAKDFLGWQAERNLEDMVTDSWRWQSKNPEGFQ